MEREKEIYKLVNVLRRTARMAMHSHWTGSAEDTAAHCTQQYNRVRSRLTELDSSIEKVFAPLPDDSSLTVVAMACRQLAAYFEDEVGAPKDWGGEWKGIWAHPRFGVWLDKRAFKEFWEKSAHEIEDLGEFIRENIETWFKQKHEKQKKTEEPPKQPHPSEGGSWKDESV